MRRYLALVVALLLWSAMNVPRIGQPFKLGHDAYVSSQFGAFAYRHATLGLKMTRGCLLTAIDYEGKPRFYSSYTPFASWLIALPMLFGLTLHTTVRLVTCLFYILFLISLWAFSRHVWGQRVANVAVMTAVVLPVSLRYGLSLYWDMSFAPLFCALALYASPRPRTVRWAVATGLASTAAALTHWLSWLLIVPCVVREIRQGHRKLAATVGAAAVLIPLIVQVSALSVTGVPLSMFLTRVADRMGATQWQGAAPVMGYRQLLGTFIERMCYSLGPIPFGLMSVVTIVAIVAEMQRDPSLFPTRRWLFLLWAYALPLGLLARNLVTYHDMTFYLVPLAAISTGIAFKWGLDQPLQGRCRQLAVYSGAFLLLFSVAASGIWPIRASFAPTPDDYATREVARTLALRCRGIQPLVISPGCCAEWPTRATAGPPTDLKARERTVLPALGCLTSKMGIICYDPSEVPAIAASTREKGPVLLLARGRELDPLPTMSGQRTIGEYTIGVYRQHSAAPSRH